MFTPAHAENTDEAEHGWVFNQPDEKLLNKTVKAKSYNTISDQGHIDDMSAYPPAPFDGTDVPAGLAINAHGDFAGKINDVLARPFCLDFDAKPPAYEEKDQPVQYDVHVTDDKVAEDITDEAKREKLRAIFWAVDQVNNPNNIYKQFDDLSPDAGRKVTQTAIWKITNNKTDKDFCDDDNGDCREKWLSSKEKVGYWLPIWTSMRQASEALDEAADGGGLATTVPQDYRVMTFKPTNDNGEVKYQLLGDGRLSSRTAASAGTPKTPEKRDMGTQTESQKPDSRDIGVGGDEPLNPEKRDMGTQTEADKQQSKPKPSEPKEKPDTNNNSSDWWRKALIAGGAVAGIGAIAHIAGKYTTPANNTPDNTPNNTQKSTVGDTNNGGITDSIVKHAGVNVVDTTDHNSNKNTVDNPNNASSNSSKTTRTLANTGADTGVLALVAGSMMTLGGVLLRRRRRNK